MEQCYYTGSSLRVSGHGGAAIRNVSAHGIFSPGVWYTQTESFQWQPKESTLPNMYRARAPLSGKHGIKAKTNQDTHLITKIALDSLPLVN